MSKRRGAPQQATECTVVTSSGTTSAVQTGGFAVTKKIRENKKSAWDSQLRSLSRMCKGLRHLWMFMIEHHLVREVWKWRLQQRDWLLGTYVQLLLLYIFFPSDIIFLFLCHLIIFCIVHLLPFNFALKNYPPSINLSIQYTQKVTAVLTICVSRPVVSFLKAYVKRITLYFPLVFFIQCCPLIRATLLDKAMNEKTKLFSFCLDFRQMYKMFLLIHCRQSQGQDLRKVIH